MMDEVSSTSLACVLESCSGPLSPSSSLAHPVSDAHGGDSLCAALQLILTGWHQGRVGREALSEIREGMLGLGEGLVGWFFNKEKGSALCSPLSP